MSINGINDLNNDFEVVNLYVVVHVSVPFFRLNISKHYVKYVKKNLQEKKLSIYERIKRIARRDLRENSEDKAICV